MTRARPEELPVDSQVAMSGMPMKTRDGVVMVGFPAVRRALMQTPLGALVAWALYVPVVRTIGRKVYGRVAVNRRRDAACPTHEGGRRQRREAKGAI